MIFTEQNFLFVVTEWIEWEGKLLYVKFCKTSSCSTTNASTIFTFIKFYTVFMQYHAYVVVLTHFNFFHCNFLFLSHTSFNFISIVCEVKGKRLFFARRELFFWEIRTRNTEWVEKKLWVLFYSSFHFYSLSFTALVVTSCCWWWWKSFIFNDCISRFLFIIKIEHEKGTRDFPFWR